MKYVIVSLFLLLLSCANEGTLTGGPADTTAPTVLESNPSNDTTNIGNRVTFYFKFSERVDQNSVEDHLRVLPLSDNRNTFEWNGWDEVSVTLGDTLKDFQTYQLVLSKGYKDLHNVPSAAEYKIAFTSRGELDSESISGQIRYSGKVLSQIRVALFDTLKSKFKPQYVADVSDDLRFELSRIKAGSYTGFFFNDANNDFQLNLESEHVAFPSKGFNTEHPNRELDYLHFFVADTIKPELVAVDSASSGIYKLKFSEAVDMEKSTLFFMDTLKNELPLNYFFPTQGKEVSVYFQSDNPHEPYSLIVKKLTDLSGNVTDTTRLATSVVRGRSVDTLAFKLQAISIADSMKIYEQLDKIEFRFSTDFLMNQSKFFVFKLVEKISDKVVPTYLAQSNPRTLELTILEPLKPVASYVLHGKIADAKNWFGEQVKDSLIRREFFTDIEDRSGELRFSVRTRPDSVQMMLFDVETSKMVQNRAIPSNQEVAIKSKGGRYHLELFIDENKNSVHDLGKIKPFELSEPFYIHSDTIPIRSNWERVIGEIKL